MRRVFEFAASLVRIGWLAGIIISGAAAICLMLVVVYGVIARYFLHSPIEWGIEVPGFLLLIIISLSLAYSQVRRSHVRVEAIVDRAPWKVRCVLEAIAWPISSVYCFFLVWACGSGAFETLQYGEHSEIAHIPLFPIELLATVGIGLLCLQFLADSVTTIAKLKWENMDESKKLSCE